MLTQTTLSGSSCSSARMLTYADVCSYQSTNTDADDGSGSSRCCARATSRCRSSRLSRSATSLSRQTPKSRSCRRAAYRASSRCSTPRSSLYLLYWYKSTNTDAAHRLDTQDDAAKEQALLALRNFSTSPDNAAKIVRERGLAPLVACLRCADDKVNEHAIVVLRNVAVHAGLRLSSY
jgi:hypothetical protein